MLSQLKNSFKERKYPPNQIEGSPFNFQSSSSVFNPFPFTQQNKLLGKTQPITSQSIPKHGKKQSTSTARSTVHNKKKQAEKQDMESRQICLQDEDVGKIIEQSSSLIKNNQIIEGINLLKAMKDPSIKISSDDLRLVIGVNLGVAYYQSGFLEEAFDEFSEVIQGIEKCTQSTQRTNKKILYMTLNAKVQLQICILFSQLGNHQDALKHAWKSCRKNFQLIYEVVNSLCKDYLRQNADKHNEASELNSFNNILLLEHLHKLIGDLNQVFHVPEKIKLAKELLTNVMAAKVGNRQVKVDMDMLYHNTKESLAEQQHHPKLSWIYTNKILDQIQLRPLSPNHFDLSTQITNFQIVQKITYLAISFYCYSTQIRFIEKSAKLSQQHDIKQSEHWLSRSLEIAYSFMPGNAPILNQILTVHDRFHSIDKQTIPEDKEVGGYFKVLKPLSKPKSFYSSKSHACAPIMIRIQAPSVSIEVDQTRRVERRIVEEQEEGSRVIELETFTKNNKIKGLNTRIKILQFTDTTKYPFLVKKSHQQNTSKITANTTISDLSSLQTQHQKKQRIAKIYNSHNITNRRTISTSGTNKDNDLHQAPKSATDLQGKAIISEDLLYRPQSYDNKQAYNKWSSIEQTTKAYSMTQSIKKRRSLSQNTRNKQKLEKIVYNGCVKLDGLKLTGKRMNDTFEIDNTLLQKLTQAHNINNDNEELLVSAREGGNIYINNNINLFIAKDDIMHYPKTGRHQSKANQDNISKRQKIIAKRRLSHLNVTDGAFL